MVKPSTNISSPQKSKVMLLASAIAPLPIEERATIAIPSGMKYKVTDEDMAGGKVSAWNTIADKFGLPREYLTVFNVDPQTKSLIQISSGVEIYIPSSEEVLFSQIYERRRAFSKIGESYRVYGSGIVSGRGRLVVVHDPERAREQ